MFSLLFLTLFTFCSQSQLPPNCSNFTPPAQQNPLLDIHQRNPHKNGKNAIRSKESSNSKIMIDQNIKTTMFAASVLLLLSVLAASIFMVREWIQKSFRNSFAVLNKAESAERTEPLQEEVEDREGGTEWGSRWRWGSLLNLYNPHNDLLSS